MDVETWQLLLGLAGLVIVYGIAVGVVGIAPGTVTVAIIGVVLGVLLGRYLSDRIESSE